MRPLRVQERVNYVNNQGSLSAWEISCVMYLQKVEKYLFLLCFFVAVYSSRLEMETYRFNRAEKPWLSISFSFVPYCKLEGKIRVSTLAEKGKPSNLRLSLTSKKDNLKPVTS